MSGLTHPNRQRPLAVEWHEAVWRPAITVRILPPSQAMKPLQIKGFLTHSVRRFNLNKIMKPKLTSFRRSRRGFTLVELLTVIAIIGILAAMLLPVLATVSKKAKEKKAKIEEQNIVTAIEAYDSAYGRLPVSKELQNTWGNQSDFTFGGSVFQTTSLNASFYTNNSEVIAILMDFTNYPNSTLATANNGHQKNPHSTKFLTATMSGDPLLPGVGPDLVYRDPWGNPYIISMDLNYDDYCNDAMYQLQAVSQNPPPGSYVQTGYNGLVNPNSAAISPAQYNDFQFHGKVMVWSAGADKQIAPGLSANVGVNKDNILSWK